MSSVEEKEAPIKTMKLYTHLDRIQRELQDAGLMMMSNNKDTSTANSDVVILTAEDLSAYDSMHYLGDAAVRQSIVQAGITAHTKILDIGSGFGGPARLLAHWVEGCQVDALELQPDVHQEAAKLTAQCGLSKAVHHYCGNILDLRTETGSSVLPLNKQYDAIVSWLVFLHIGNRKKLFQQCWKLLQPGGKMYVEDFCRVDGPFTARERNLLAEEIYVQHELPTWTQMRQELQDQGFVVTAVDDKTVVWRDFVKKREQEYASALQRHERVHGADAAASLLTFYKAVHELFQGGRLGGVAYTVEKPLE